MSVDWDGYEVFDPGVAGPLNKVPRAEARKAFTRCIASKPARIEMLRQLLQANGVELSTRDAGVQDLNDWFYANVEADPAQPGGRTPAWCSVGHDVALFLGDVMVERNPNLHWEFFTWGKTNVAFQRHVIMGFSTEEPRFHTNIDIDRLVATYAQRIIESRGSIPTYGAVEVRGTAIDVDAVAERHRKSEIETDMFWRWLLMAAQRA